MTQHYIVVATYTAKPETADQVAALRQRLAEDRKRIERERAKEAARAAEVARKAWAALQVDGESLPQPGGRDAVRLQDADPVGAGGEDNRGRCGHGGLRRPR